MLAVQPIKPGIGVVDLLHQPHVLAVVLTLDGGSMTTVGICEVSELLLVNPTDVFREEVSERSVSRHLHQQHRHDRHKDGDHKRHFAPTKELSLGLSARKHRAQILSLREYLGPHRHQQTENARAEKEGKELKACKLHDRNVSERVRD